MSAHDVVCETRRAVPDRTHFRKIGTVVQAGHSRDVCTRRRDHDCAVCHTIRELPAALEDVESSGTRNLLDTHIGVVAVFWNPEYVRHVHHRGYTGAGASEIEHFASDEVWPCSHLLRVRSRRRGSSHACPIIPRGEGLSRHHVRKRCADVLDSI